MELFILDLILLMASPQIHGSQLPMAKQILVVVVVVVYGAVISLVMAVQVL